MRHLVERTAHGITRQCCRTCRIHLVTQIIQYVMVIQHILLILCGYGDLIGYAPCHDTRMIVILYDQFLHLADRILPAAGHMFRNIWNLRPDDHSVLITQIVEILIVLVVGETHGIRADLAYHFHIFPVVFFCKSVSDPSPVLMSGNAVKRIGTSV